MSATGAPEHMTERQTLYRLVEDVGGLKKDAESGARSREVTREKVDKVEESLNDLHRKVDVALAQERRLRDCEEGVSDYRHCKTRLLSTIAGVGLGMGGMGGAMSAWLSRWLGSGGS